MDALDLSILSALETDARRSYADLARELGVSQPTVTERVKRLEERGVILGTYLKLDYAKLGFPIQAMIRIVSDTRAQLKLEEIARALPQVVEMHRVTGEDCLIARVVARSVEEMSQLIDQLCQFGNSNTSIVLATPIAARSPLEGLMPKRKAAARRVP